VKPTTSTEAAASATLTLTTGTLTNAAGASINCLTGAGGSRTVNSPLDNQGTLSVAAGSTLTLNGSLAEFSGATLSGGTYDIAGTFQFPGAAITTNAATIILDGPGAQIVDEANNNALTNFATNAADGSFTVQGGESFATSPTVAFSNAGTLIIGAGSTFNVTGTWSNFSGTTLTGGTFVIGGTLQFTDADIVTNAATIVLDSPSAQILDQANNNALANFTTNTDSGNLTLQNGDSLTVGAFSNAGYLEIDSDSTFTATGAFSQSTTASLILYGTLSLTAGGSIDSTILNAGNLLFGAGATFTVSGTYTVTGTLDVPAGTILNLTGTFTNFSGTTLTGGTYVIAGTLMFAGANIETNAATTILDGPAAQIVDESGNDALANFTTNAAGGSFTIENGRNFATAAAVSFDNLGVLTIGAGSAFTVTGGFANFANQTLTGGTYDINGTLQFANADIQTNAATIVLDGPAAQIVDFSSNDALANFRSNAASGSFTIQDGYNFATAASVTFDNAGVLVIGAGSTFTVVAGFANFDGMTLTGGTYVISGTLQFANADIQTNAATIVLNGPAAQIVDLSGNDALADFTTNAATGSFTIENGRNFTPAGDFTNAGTLIIGTGSTFTANGAYTQTGAAIVQYQGMLCLAGGGSASGSFTVFTQGVVQWTAGTFTLDTGTMLSGEGLFQVAGATVNLTDAVTIPNLELDSGELTGTGDLTITYTLVWTGGVMSGTGATNLAAGSTFSLSGTMDLGGRTLNVAGTLSGSGTIIGTVVNSGQMDPVGILTIQGDYTQTAQGILTIELDGTTAGADYGQLVVTGLATLDGTLNIELANGYLPNVGDSFDVLLFGSVSGDFATENGLDLSSGLQFDPEYRASGLQFDPEYRASGLTLVAMSGTLPPGGGASVAGNSHFPGLDRVAIPSLLHGNSGNGVHEQRNAARHQGIMARASLDTFFPLLADTASSREPWVVYSNAPAATCLLTSLHGQLARTTGKSKENSRIPVNSCGLV
jgi:fibronectin-binding autotransporter adhesin